MTLITTRSLVSLCLASAVISASKAQAAVFQVSTVNDSGAGSLRAAIVAANSRPGADSIVFTDGVSGVVALATALPALADAVFIQGPAAQSVTVARSSGSQFRIFTVGTNVTVHVSGLALTNGSAASGGGILNSGFLTLDSVRIAGNEATGPFADGGGGILNFKSLVLSNSVVAGNRSANSGGGIRNINGTVAVVASEVSDNVGGTGGGIANHSGALSVNSSTIARNFTYDGGGGIINYFGRTDVLNSTISGNNVQSAKGGGGLLASYGEVSIQFSTIASNLAVNGGNGGGLRKEVSATMTVGNSIVAFNRASTGGDYYGTVTFTDRNVFTGDFGLGPLADNGGPTPTHLPASNSPAVDAGNPSGAPAVDQRGVSRPQGAVPDIGSVETSVAVAAPELRLSMRREGQELVFTFPAAQGASYTVEYVDALHPDASWSVLLQGLHATNGVAEFREPLDVQQPQRYYRARLN